MTGLDNLIAAYVRLLVFEYQLPKAQAMCAILVKQFLMDGVLLDIEEAYDPNNAVGAQLDVVAKYIGLPRTIGLPVDLPYFGYRSSNGLGDNNNGYSSAQNGLNGNVVYYRAGYQGTQLTELSDQSYSFMLALQIILNASDGTLASIDAYLDALLPGAVSVTDNLDMTLTYTVTGVLPVDPAVLSAYLPKPMGVGVNITTNDFIITDGGDFIVTDGGDKLVTTAVL